jgi:hypothetical protein
MYNADNSAGVFDRITLQTCIQACFSIQYAELFCIECQLGNIRLLRNQMAIVVIVVIVIAVIVIAVIVIAVIVIAIIVIAVIVIAIIVIAVIVIAIIVITVVVVVVTNVGTNHVSFSFRFESFEKFLGDTCRQHNYVRCTYVDDMWVTTNVVVEMIKLNVVIVSL